MKLLTAVLDIAAVPGVPIVTHFIYGLISQSIIAIKTKQPFTMAKYINVHSKSDVSIFVVCLLGFIHAIYRLSVILF